MTSSVQSENLIFQCSFPVTPADQDLPQSLAPSLGAKNGTSSSMLKRYYRYKKVWQMDYIEMATKIQVEQMEKIKSDFIERIFKNFTMS